MPISATTSNCERGATFLLTAVSEPPLLLTTFATPPRSSTALVEGASPLMPSVAAGALATALANAPLRSVAAPSTAAPSTAAAPSLARKHLVSQAHGSGGAGSARSREDAPGCGGGGGDGGGGGAGAGGGGAVNSALIPASTAAFRAACLSTLRSERSLAASASARAPSPSTVAPSLGEKTPFANQVHGSGVCGAPAGGSAAGGAAGGAIGAMGWP